MRKFFFILFILCLTVSITACQLLGNNPTSDRTHSALITRPTESNPEPSTNPTKPTAIIPTESTAPSTMDTEPNTTPPPWSHEFALTRFLAEVNHSGSILPSETLEEPGSLPSIEQIPVADQSLVGECVTIILAQEQQQIPFYYYYDADSSLERLAVVVNAESIPLLIIFEPELGGAAELSNAIATETEFDAAILAMTNISFEEGCVYIRNVCQRKYQEQQLDVFSNAISEISGQYIGIVGTDYGETLTLLAGAENTQLSDALQSGISVWFRTFQRFGLNEIVCPS